MEIVKKNFNGKEESLIRIEKDEIVVLEHLEKKLTEVLNTRIKDLKIREGDKAYILDSIRDTIDFIVE